MLSPLQVCSRCVRCKSCGATTPGSDPKAQWMHGFSHCQECGKLFEKGNYCPVCKKCYEDDDFESKMVQCADCNRWVHAKCENLSDDQYRILTELPDSVPYRCPPCAKNKPTPWKGEVDEELQAGFMNVLNALYSCKNAGHLIWPNRRFKYMRKVHNGDSSRSSNGPESRESSSSPALSEASSLERETPTPDRGLEAGGDGQDDVEETYSFRRGRTVRRVLRRRRQQRNAGNADGAGKGDEDGGMRSKDSGREDVDVEEVGRTLRDGDGSRSDNAESDVVMVDGDDDARSSGSIHPVFDRDAERTDGDVQKTSSTEPFVADTDKTELNVSDDDRVIAVDDEEDDALRTKKEEQKPEDGPISFSTTAQGDVASSVESIPIDTSQENISSESHVPKDDNNAERTSHRVSMSSEDIAMTSADDLEPPVVESSPTPVVEDQKHESQMVVESKDRTEVVSSEPKCTNNSSLADSQGVDHQDGSGGSLGDSKMDTSNLASDGETSAAEEVDIDIESTDVKGKRMEVDDVDDSGRRSSVEERTSRDTNTPLPEDASGSLVDTATVAPDDAASPKLEKEEAETVSESETKVSIVSPEAVPDVDPNIPDAVLEVTTSTQPEQDASKTPAKVVTIEIGKKEEEEKKEEEIKPTSFQFVKAKMMAGYYKSVEKFTKDCVTIFQASFNQETSLIPGLSKSNVIAKGAFFKIMIQMFPWFNIEDTRLWNGEERFEENGVLQVAVEPPHKDHEYAQWRYRALMPAITAQPSPFKKLPTPRRRHSIIGGNRCSEDDSHLTALDDVSDPRRCCLCGVMGDDDPNNAGRLLYCGQDEWIHINCALWSAEVFEEVDGSLINVHAAISRGRMMRCEVCNNLGATVGCCSRGCPANFHFMCARSRNAMFQEDKKVYCFQHTDKVDKAIMGSDLFGVLRRVCVSLDNMKPNRTFSQGLEAKNINVMIGSWSLESLGHLGFLSDTENGIFPLDFACSRVYWSTVDPCRRCIYTMRIIEVNPLTSPTLPQEINHTTEHSPGSYPFSRKPTVQDDDDTDILADALMEATKESNEAAMALDQVAALLAGSQTVSEIQNAADILAATSSLFEMDDGVLDSLNLDANLNPCLDGDGIMDMMADLDNLDGLNSDAALGDFSESGEKFLQSDKPVSLPSANPTNLDTDDIVSAVSKEVQEETSTPQTDSAVTLFMDDSVKEMEEKPNSPAGMMETEEKHAKVAVNDEAEIETDIAECSSNIRPDSPLTSPKKGPYVKLVDIKDKQLASVVTSDSAEASDVADASDTSMPLHDDPEVTQPDSPLISPKKVPMLKLVKLALDQHEKSYPESEDDSSEAASDTHRNTTPHSGCREFLDNPQTSCMLSTNVSPLPNQPDIESAMSQPLSLPSVSISPSEKESSPRLPSKDKSSEVTDSELSARSREEKGTDLASRDFEVTKGLTAEIKEAETVGADGPIEQIEQNSSTERLRMETDSTPIIVPESPNEKPCEVTPSKMSVGANAETREVTPSNEQITLEPEIQNDLCLNNEAAELIEGKSSDTAAPGYPEEQEHLGMEIAPQGQIKSDEEVGNVVTSFEVDIVAPPEGKTREDDTLVISDCSAATTLAEPEEPRDGGTGCLDGAEDQADGHGLQVDFPSESHDAIVGTEETSMMKIPTCTGDAAQSVSMASYQNTKTAESFEEPNVQQFKPQFPLHESQCPPIDEQHQVQSPIRGEDDDNSNEEANVGKVSEEEQQRCIVIHSVDDSPTSSPGELGTSDSLSGTLSNRAENLTHSPNESTAVQDLPTQSPVDLDIDVMAVSTDSLSSTDVPKQFKSLGSQDASQPSSPDIPGSDQEENTTKESLTDSTSNVVTVLDDESLSNPDDICHEIQDVSSDDEVETVQLLGKRDPDVVAILDTKDDKSALPLDVPADTPQDSPEDMEKEPQIDKSATDVTILSTVENDSNIIEISEPCSETASVGSLKSCLTSTVSEENHLPEAPAEQNNEVPGKRPSINKESTNEPIATGCAAERSFDGDISTAAPDHVEHGARYLEDSTPDKTGGPHDAGDWSVTPVDAQLESSAPFPEIKEINIVNEERSVLEKQEQKRNYDVEDEVEAKEVSPEFERLTEELRVQGVGEEDILSIVVSQKHQSPQEVSENANPVIFAKDAPPRRLSSDPEHESIFKALATSLSSSVTRKNNNNRESLRRQEREPILSAFASDLNSRHHKHTLEDEEEPEKVEKIGSPTTSRNIFKKLDNPKFANAFKAFMETKQDSARNVVDELIDGDLVREEKNAGDIKRRKSSRLSSADSTSADKFHSVLQNGDDSHIASSFTNSDQTKRKTRHSSSDVLESDDSSSKLDVLDVGHRGRKKYPMRTTSSRLLRIADSGDPDNQVFSGEEDVERSDACHDQQTPEGQEDDITSLTRKSSDTSHDGRRRLSSDDSLKSPRSFSRKKSHHASQQDEFDGDQEEKENEAVKGRRGRPRKSLDIIWSPEKECGTLNHIEAEELEGRPMRTRGLSRKSSSRMKEIIAAELEDEDDGDTEEIVQKKGRGRGRGRPRKYPVADQIQVGHISAREGEKPRGRGRPRKYPSVNEVSRDQIEARKRGRDGACADFEVLEKGQQEEEGMPKRKRGRPRLSDKQPEKDQFVDSENENAGDDSKKRMRGELTSTSDEEHHGPEQDQPRLRTRSSAKRLKPGEEPVEDGEETLDSKPSVSSRSEERQVHPRKQSVVARSFPGEDAQSGTQSPSKKGLLADSRDSSKQTNMLPNNEVVMHGEAAITPKLNQMKQVQETPDTSSETPMAESSSSEKQVRVTVKIDPVTGAISEAFTYTDDESMEVDMGLNDDPPPPQALSVEANPTQPALPSQTPWNILGKSTQGVSDLNSSNQLKGRNIYHVQSNIGSKKVIIGKDVTTNQVIYSNGPTSVRNPTGGPRIRGPSMIRYPGLLPNNTRQARTRGPFSRNSSVVWQGNTAALKPGVNAKILKTPVATQQAITSIQGTIPQKMQVGVSSVAAQSIALTGQPISNLLPNTVPGILSSQGMSSAMNLPQGFQSLPQAALVATSIVTTVGSPDVLSVVTTTANTNTLTSSAQEQYLSILQRSYQVSQIQQVNALAGIMPQTYPQPGLLQNFGVPQIGVASPEVAPFINQTYPTLMASSTLQTLQTLIQQAGVQSSMGQVTPGVQPLTPSPTPVIPVNPLLPTTPMDTSLSGFISSLSPPFQQQPGIVPLTSYTDAMSPFHREHMYARQKSGGSNKRRKSPHQVKVWFDSYGSLKNEDDENQEETSNKVPSPSPVKTPVVRMKNPSNVPRARVKNPTFGMEETRSNKSLIKVSKKKSKGSDGSSSWNPNTSYDPFAGLSTDDAFFAAMPNLGQSDHHDDSPSLLLTLMEQEKKRGPSTTPRRPSNRPHLMFEIRSDDGFETRAETVEEAWGRVVERAGELRTNTRRKHLSFDGVKGLKMLGINHEAIIFLMEQLYGAGNCQKYKFKFHKHEETAEDDEPPVNPHGCARAEVSKRTSTFDIFNFLASHHRNRPIFNEFEQQDETSDIQHKSSRRATSLQDLPMAMRFRHLKQTAKEAVGVYRSGIHGRGLFCRRLIEAGEMVIEYSGIVIRSILTDKREKYYESKGIGCYMFRIDDFDVVDATTSGNAARFINHSCDSNCFSRVIEVGGQKHIIIFASRRIAKGEELTYDYKFPIEDVKIPCNCGSRKCRKYLN
ncbi:uncharacterized protein LOC579728 [Strongylocentrotus purpuratus]|uniref:[Histone H3]-lysine(4) N-trimethyltransferase n=1 Tax=Strongylocentrotus purpuratus TaxID=7668 RepID=A0A7M7SVI7_STRPU|nr:uncharacterized protein LOC579728 [Strongylocentrotus purpuratus]